MFPSCFLPRVFPTVIFDLETAR